MTARTFFQMMAIGLATLVVGLPAIALGMLVPGQTRKGKIFRWVTKRLGLVPGASTLAKAALSLEPHVGVGDHGPLHLNLIRLGREVCRPRNPLCAECPLLTVCPEGARNTKRRVS